MIIATDSPAFWYNLMLPTQQTCRLFLHETHLLMTCCLLEGASQHVEVDFNHYCVLAQKLSYTLLQMGTSAPCNFANFTKMTQKNYIWQYSGMQQLNFKLFPLQRTELEQLVLSKGTLSSGTLYLLWLIRSLLRSTSYNVSSKIWEYIFNLLIYNSETIKGGFAIAFFSKQQIPSICACPY